MYSVNPFSSQPASGGRQQIESSPGPRVSLDDKVSQVSLQVLEDELREIESGSSIDRSIAEEKNRQLEYLRAEFQALQELMQDFSHLVVQQGEGLNQVEEHVEVTEEEVIEADAELEVAVKEVNKSRRAGFGALIGGGAGGALGLVGFAVNPAVGVLMLLGGTALGGSLGGLIGMATKK